MENLHQDFKDFLNLLNDHQVEYLLVGGYAVSIHGYPRYTGDIDIWIEVSRGNARRMVAVMKEFGFDVNTLSEEMFLDPNRMARLGREPVKIEVLNSISGVEFGEAYARGVDVEVDGVRIPVISLADLRANKLASGRLKDLADLENLPEEGEV